MQPRIRLVQPRQPGGSERSASEPHDPFPAGCGPQPAAPQPNHRSQHPPNLLHFHLATAYYAQLQLINEPFFAPTTIHPDAGMIISRTPYRVSFFGGGTDYPAWYRRHGGAVLSAAIARYCYLTCRWLPPFFEHKSRIVYSIIEASSASRTSGTPPSANACANSASATASKSTTTVIFPR